MKIVLVQPPILDFYDTDVRLQPIGLCYLKAAIQKHHPDVEVIVRDYHFGHGRRTVPIPQELEYLKEFYKYPDRSPFSTFHNYFHFGLDFEGIERDLESLNPDVVGISSLFTPYYREALEVAKRARKVTKGKILLGGSHVSALPEFTLKHDCVDWIIRGEGERPIVELISALKNNLPLSSVPNLGYKDQNRLVMNPTQDNFAIEEIPYPEIGPADSQRYSFWGRPMTFMITSRSCPHKCSFCSVHLTFGNSYRRRAVEDVVEEIKLRHSQGYRVIDFEDDNLTFYKKDMKELCRRLINEFPNREMQFVAMNGISYISLDDELMELMRDAGFTHLNLALVSSDKLVREATKRPHTTEAYLRVVHKAFDLGMKVTSYQILGLPNETLESMIQTMAFNAGLPVLLGASMFYQTPASPIAKGLNLDETDYFKARLTSMAIETPTMNRRQLYSLFVVTRVLNYLKGLDLETDENLADLLERGKESEAEIGLELLKEVLEGKGLLVVTRTGRFPNLGFDPEILLRVFNSAGNVTTLKGRRIHIGARHQPRPLEASI